MFFMIYLMQFVALISFLVTGLIPAEFALIENFARWWT